MPESVLQLLNLHRSRGLRDVSSGDKPQCHPPPHTGFPAFHPGADTCVVSMEMESRQGRKQDKEDGLGERGGDGA